jgi:hypothetical protein
MDCRLLTTPFLNLIFQLDVLCQLSLHGHAQCSFDS